VLSAMNQAIIICQVYINTSIISIIFETASDLLSVYSNATSHYYEVLQAMTVLIGFIQKLRERKKDTERKCVL
jgi:hypothetical protein